MLGFCLACLSKGCVTCVLTFQIVYLILFYSLSVSLSSSLTLSRSPEPWLLSVVSLEFNGNPRFHYWHSSTHRHSTTETHIFVVVVDVSCACSTHHPTNGFARQSRGRNRNFGARFSFFIFLFCALVCFYFVVYSKTKSNKPLAIIGQLGHMQIGIVVNARKAVDSRWTFLFRSRPLLWPSPLSCQPRLLINHFCTQSTHFFHRKRSGKTRVLIAFVITCCNENLTLWNFELLFSSIFFLLYLLNEIWKISIRFKEVKEIF